MTHEIEETYDLRERPLRVTVRELNAVRDGMFHRDMIDEAGRHLDAALRFQGVLPYEELQDEVEREGQALAQDLKALIARYRRFADRHAARERDFLNGLYEPERTIYA